MLVYPEPAEGIKYKVRLSKSFALFQEGLRMSFFSSLHLTRLDNRTSLIKFLKRIIGRY